MPRVAWFAPLPPARSGIARYNWDLLPTLSALYQIDLFVDGDPRRFASPDERARVFEAHDFVWKSRREPYELVVYQMGNAPCHDYMWAYLVRFPGLVVLHDGQLHHARARQLLQQKRYDDYRGEFRFNHPDANPDVAELGADGLLGSLTYLWPMLRLVVQSSRLVVVHNRWLAGAIRDVDAKARIEVVQMGVPAAAPRNGAAAAIRLRHHIAEDAVLFMALGKVTPEKRIREAIRALAALGDAVPNAHLLIAGENVEYYDALAEARSLGIDGMVTIAGFVADDDIDDYLAAADICLCMRWPTSRETSASWLRCIAAGRPTITTDLAHTVDIPMLDPRSWSVLHASAGLEAGTTRDIEPVGVSIDIVDEDHSLRLAMRRLATDTRLRTMLGTNARTLWNDRFRLDQMASRYQAVIDLALALPLEDSASRAPLPTHLFMDGTEHAEELLRAAGLSGALRDDLWRGHSG